MKNYAFKHMMKLAWLLVIPMLVFVACDKDDPEPPILVEDGYYIKGAVSPFDDLATGGLMEPGKNEVGQVMRPGLYEKYITLRAGAAGFNISKVSGQTQTLYGPSGMQTINTEGEREQPNISVQVGTLGTGGVFTVPQDGLYHVVIDETLNKVVIAPVPFWAIIGGATAAGWSDTQLPLVGGFNQESMKFEQTGIVLRSGDFKFRYGGGWKLEVDGEAGEVKVNTNFGGDVEGTLPNLTTTLIPGGENYAFSREREGVYTVTIEWTLEDGFSSKLTKTDDVPPLDYPEELFMIGDGVGTWDWAETNLPMIPVHSKPHLFWKIVWMNAEGSFKFAPQRAWNGDFGRMGNAANGIYARGGDNVPVPGTAGYYMVVVNFETEQIAVVNPKVYLIGDAAGGWDAGVAANLFTVDNANQVITITKAFAAGNLRMYAWFDAAGWFTDWWQAEFNIFDGKIEFRGKGGDQAAVPLTAGNKKIDLNFRTGAGTITAQ